MMRRLLLTLLFGLLSLSILPVLAQDQVATEEPLPSTGVYVTTQDYSVLRLGPGQAFARLDIVPPATTLMATGRTTDAHWIQVRFNDQPGWIASWLLVWSGDMLALPADGINPVSFVRRRGPTVTVTNTMYMYDQQFFAPGQRIDFPAETARVEITGRLGSGNNFWLQFWYVDRYYWLGAWNLHLAVPGTFFTTVPDAAYVYPYGRLLGKVYNGYATTVNTYYTISSIWNSLATGQSMSCDSNPGSIKDVEFSETDLILEPVFVPAVRALQTAVTQTNNAIASLDEACARTGSDRFLTTDIVDTALNNLAEASRNLDLIDILLPPVSNRDPALGGSG
ncbi:MAG: hypothetical protein ABI690_10745 [Chloroflexota bacterium]